MNVLVCVKRVPAAGDRIRLTADGMEVDTRNLGFTISPHEECAVEEAVRLVEAHGGSSTVLTVGPAAADEQLRDAMALGIEQAVLVETDDPELDAMATAASIARAVRDLEVERSFDLVLLGNESADTADYQVPIRVAYALGRPCVTGVKSLEIRDGTARAGRDAAGTTEIYELPLPAVVGVREGLNLPRYPSVRGRLNARKKEIGRLQAQPASAGLTKTALRLPDEQKKQVEMLGEGAAAVPRVIEVLRDLGVLAR